MANIRGKWARVRVVAKVHDAIPAIAATERSIYPAANGMSAARAMIATTVSLPSMVMRFAREKNSADVDGYTQKKTTTTTRRATSP